MDNNEEETMSEILDTFEGMFLEMLDRFIQDVEIRIPISIKDIDLYQVQQVLAEKMAV